ncbi:SusC/RagA family TonB-linked outer membrane protein [Bacteroidota bacterium]
MNLKKTIIWHIFKKICPNKTIGSIHVMAVILILNVSQVSASPSPLQEREVSGTVSDQAGSPILGVSVAVVGTITGTITDYGGNFSIVLPEGARTLSFSFVGMTTQEVEIGNQTVFNITLEEGTTALDEVVVIGYGTIRKSHLTGAISKVTNDRLEQIPTSRIEEALVGKISGVTIQMVNASAGSAPTIRVRGVGSITADPSPLIVMDGVVVSSDFLGSIDMSDIESVEVLKDAASAAIYGSRGGNGVIMLTTKKGTPGKTTFSFNAYKGVKYTFPERRYEPFSTLAQWKDYVLTNNNGVLTDEMKYAELMGTETRWSDAFFDNGAVANYSLSARGGTDKTKFAISTNYMRDEGVLLTDGFKKMSLRLNLSTKPHKRIEFGGMINPSYSNQRLFADNVHAVLRACPWLPIYHDENTIQYVRRDAYPDVKVGDYAMERHFDGYILPGNTTGTSISTSSSINPVARVVEKEEFVNNLNLFTNMFVTLNIAKGLNFTSSISASYRNKLESDWAGKDSDTGGRPSNIESAYSTGASLHLTNENIFSYNRLFGKHEINAIAGASFEKWNHTDSEIEATGFAFDYIHTINAASRISGASTEIMEESLAAIISRLNYSYDNRLLLSLSARYDGSSRFGADTKWGFFPAGSVGWRISEEDFMNNISWLSNLKARVSYGTTGNNSGIGYYSSIGRLEPITAILNGSKLSGFNPINISNTDLRWEKSVEIGPGVDIGILRNRFTMSLDYYVRQSKDLLLDQEIASATGFNTATVNIGEVKNYGFEMELGATPVSMPGISWTTSLILSHNTNELVDFAGANGLITFEDSKRATEYIALEGNPISSFYGYKYVKDIPLEWLKDPFYPINGKGDYCYVQDMNGDGVITPDDRSILGSPYPKWVWGFNNTIIVKMFDLSFSVQGSHGAKTLNLDPQYWEKHFDSQMAYKTDFPDIDQVVHRIYTDKCIQDASYVALRSVNLGFRIPSNLSSKIGLTSARFYVSGQNLIFIMSDSYTSFNPEGVTEDTSPLRGGYQVGTPPMPSAVTLGLTLDF